MADLPARADLSREKLLQRYLHHDGLIIDDFGLKALTVNQADAFYELVYDDYLEVSLILTSNRTVEEWLGPSSCSPCFAWKQKDLPVF